MEGSGMSISDKKRWTIQQKIAVIADGMHFKTKTKGPQMLLGWSD